MYERQRRELEVVVEEMSQHKMAPHRAVVPGDAVQAYRNYYHQAKPFAKWDWGRPAPDWWKGYQVA